MAVDVIDQSQYVADEPQGAGVLTAGFASLALAPPGADQPVLSVVVPTRNEAGNIAELVSRLERVFPSGPVEIVFVDDSDDQTPQVIETVRTQSRHSIVLIHRPAGQQEGGLGGAVVAGLGAARAPWICVMDADLQHPPDLIPQMLDRADRDSLDLVIASRYDKHSSHAGLSIARTFISHGLHTIARLAFPGRLRNISDPLTGFFLIRREALDLDKLRPRGFKILLEILIRFPELRAGEVPFQFGNRYAGQSKASVREVAKYLSLLWNLRFSEKTQQLLAFAAVGVTGLVVNSLALAFVTEVVRIHYLVSVMFAMIASTVWNFILTERWVFADRRQSGTWPKRFGLFFLMNGAALLLREPIVYVLTSGLGIHYLISNLVSLIAILLVRFALADRIIWGQPASPAETAPKDTRDRRAIRLGGRITAKRMYHYDIHGIITVQSEVALPELRWFLSNTPVERPTIRVRIGWVPRPVKKQAPESNARRIVYRENLGNFGFSASIEDGEVIEVVASPLLRWSPHVLYTNLVEPILRWTFVKKGYALVHGACMVIGDKAWMVTARTDTGKTTTMLRLLRSLQRQSIGAGFLSDDLTLVRPDGRVLPYPKPMTISFHTVQAVNPEALTPRERLALRVQSRVHSRSGRRFAFLLAQTELPVATINTIVQLLIPPPKYHVQRLVPGIEIISTAKLAGLFVIERFWAAGEAHLKDDEELEIVLNNCEDAYGFPPYHFIKEFLYLSDGLDLRTAEAEIIASALRGLPGTLICSNNLGWSQNIMARAGEAFGASGVQFAPSSGLQSE